MKILDRELRGRAVIGSDGRVLGKVAGISLDTEGPGLSTIEVELRRGIEQELGVDHRWFRSALIEVPFHQVQSIGDTIVLAIPAEALRRVSAKPIEQPAPA